jgi:hypothetical protein
MAVATVCSNNSTAVAYIAHEHTAVEALMQILTTNSVTIATVSCNVGSLQLLAAQRATLQSERTQEVCPAALRADK